VGWKDPIQRYKNKTVFVAACFGSKRRPDSMSRQRVRIRFAKQGDLRLISHRDLMRVWERLFRRAGLVLAMTEGFHPKPKMMFPSALAVGIEGLDETLEIELAESHETQRLAELMQAHAPGGLVIHSVEPLEGGRKTKLTGMTFTVEVPAERRAALAVRAVWLLSQTEYPILREGRSAPLDLRRLIDELALDDDGTLRFRLRVDSDGSARPRDVLAALELGDLEAEGTVLRRSAVELTS
jgi:radical SAM-linked protein